MNPDTYLNAYHDAAGGNLVSLTPSEQLSGTSIN